MKTFEYHHLYWSHWILELTEGILCKSNICYLKHYSHRERSRCGLRTRFLVATGCNLLGRAITFMARRGKEHVYTRFYSVKSALPQLHNNLVNCQFVETLFRYSELRRLLVHDSSYLHTVWRCPAVSDVSTTFTGFRPSDQHSDLWPKGRPRKLGSTCVEHFILSHTITGVWK